MLVFLVVMYASTERVAKYLKPSIAGFLIQKVRGIDSGLRASPSSPVLLLQPKNHRHQAVKNASTFAATVTVDAQIEQTGPEGEQLRKLAELSDKGVISIIGDSDFVSTIEKFGLAEKMSHISTADDASLELLENKPLPGVLALNDA
ncbi:phosphoglycerate kinase, cytosolic [Olea europaea subsp. europaea]|uniref:phosphoglycerate kinase n=1 Tax=Olea europaea subsp. europaea TaxID=158383 RepID=A0A8S0RU02_OLEEU|nr:phosphoglycerate kinase, cytosolic [Olea europaea subsp. europaea]